MALSIWSRVSGALVGLVAARTAADATQPIFELVEQQGWDANPNRVLDVSTLAALVAQAVTDAGDATDEARRSGYEANRLQALIQLALRAPDLATLDAMRRRRAISHEQFIHGLRKAGLEPQYDDAALALLEVLPPYTDTIRMAVREVFSPEQRAALDLDAEFPAAFLSAGRALGLSEESVRNLWAAHWELPSYTQATEMLFRGEIEQDDFRALLRAQDYAPRWRGPLEAIARRIPTPTDFLRLSRRGVYTPAERTRFELDDEFPEPFADKMALHGMVRQDALDLWAGGWRLPSAGQLYRMLWRHEIDEATLAVGLRALDYPKFWRQRLANTARPIPPRVAISTMLRRGVIAAAEGHELFMQLGYTDDHADKLVAIALPEAAGAVDESTWIGRARSRLFSDAWNDYTDGNADADEFRVMLSAVGAPDAELDRIVSLAETARQRTRRDLTQAQMVKLYKKSIWTRERAQAGLEDLGMTPGDATDLLESA